MDSAIAKALLRREKASQLAERLVPHVGTFDAAPTTPEQVAAKACERLGIPCVKGQELAVINGYLAAVNKGAASVKGVFTMDSANAVQNSPSAFMKRYLGHKNNP